MELMHAWYRKLHKNHLEIGFHFPNTLLFPVPGSQIPVLMSQISSVYKADTSLSWTVRAGP